MIVELVYSLLCTPYALGLLYRFCGTDWIWILLGKDIMSKLFVLVVAHFGSRLILWTVLYIVTVLGLRIATKEKLNVTAKLSLLTITEPVICFAFWLSSRDKKGVAR